MAVKPASDFRLIHHHVGGRAGDAPFPMPPQLGPDVLRVLYEADDTAVEQIRKASEDAGVPTLVRSDFVGLSGGRVRFAVNYCPYSSSAFPIAPEYLPYVMSESGRDYVLGEAASPISVVDLATHSLDEMVLDGPGDLPPPDMLSLDTQGGERDILVGAERLLERNILAVTTEVQFHRVYAGAAIFGEICEQLGRHKFLFVEFDQLQRYAPRRVPLGLRSPGFTLFGDATFFKDPQAMVATMGDRSGPALRKLAFLALCRAQLEFAQICLDLAPPEDDEGSSRPAYLGLVEEFRQLCRSAPQYYPWRFVDAYSAEASLARFQLIDGEAGARIAVDTTMRARAEFERILKANPPLAEAEQALALIDLFNRYGLGNVAKKVHEFQREAIDVYVREVMRIAGVERVEMGPA